MNVGLSSNIHFMWSKLWLCIQRHLSEERRYNGSIQSIKGPPSFIFSKGKRSIFHSVPFLWCKQYNFEMIVPFCHNLSEWLRIPNHFGESLTKWTTHKGTSRPPDWACSVVICLAGIEGCAVTYSEWLVRRRANVLLRWRVGRFQSGSTN